MLLILVPIYQINGSGADSRKDRSNRAFITPPMKPKSFDMALMDDTPLDTPYYGYPVSSDLQNRINRRLDFEEQEGIGLINKQEQQIENIKKINIQKNHNLKNSDGIPMYIQQF